MFCILQGVAQLVARTAGGREVASSSLVTLTKIITARFLRRRAYLFVAAVTGRIDKLLLNFYHFAILRA